MARPGVEFIERDTPPPRFAPVDTSTAFLTGLTEKGPTDEALAVSSVSEFERLYGDRNSYSSILWDSLDVLFREGRLRTAYISRVAGPTPVLATVTLDDAAAADTMRVDAKSYGDWGNKLNVQIVAGGAGGTFVVVVSHDDDGELERSGDLADVTAAVDWSENSDYVDLVDVGPSALDPAVVAATGLAGGTDDHSNAVEAQWTAALLNFLKTLGPGQVGAPARTTEAAHTALLAHAAERNRAAFLDTADSTSKATLETSKDALTDLATARYGGIFGGWLEIPGLVARTRRTVPPSVLAMALAARNDAVDDPGQAPAGIHGRSVLSLDVAKTFSEADYEDLNDTGVNMFREFAQYGGEVRLYGFRSLADKDEFPKLWQLSHTRLTMAIRARGEDIAERYVFGQIDGRGHLLAQYQGDLVGMCREYYDAGALYGATPEEAFNVDVGPAVNPIADLADGIIRAVISLRMSGMAELVRIEIEKRAITEAVV